MLRKVENFIQSNKMINPGEHVVVGVSGGADSVCLLDMLHSLADKLNFRITVVHVNHMIRGAEADSDENYVKKLCETYGIEFVCRHYDIPKISKENGESAELAGRNARYEAFYAVENVDKIAVAHHGDDQAETVLFNIFRGSSIKGAGGMRPVRGKIIRPLMCLSRAEIEMYLAERKIEFCTDSTNADVDYTRNKIRNVVIPYIKANINSEVVENINRFAEDVLESHKYILIQAEKVLEKSRVDGQESALSTEALKKEMPVIRRQVLMLMIEKISGSLKDITRKHIQAVDELIFKEVSKQVNLPYSIKAVRGYDNIRFEISDDKETETQFFLEKKDFHFEILDFEGNWENITNDYTKVFDYDKIKDNVVLRRRQPGDYFLLDETGKKKTLKSYFIDKKIPQNQRDNVWILAEGSHVLWIVGYRISAGYKTSQSTKKVLKVTIRRNDYGT